MLPVTGFSSKRRRIRPFAVLAAAFAGAALAAGSAFAAGPQPWELNFQPAATPVMQRLDVFWDELLIIIFGIGTLVLVLLIVVMVRFNHRRNPVPSRTAHHSLLEIVWTVVPVLILIIIAVPSFKLMFYMDNITHPQMVIKVTGHQWYWSYGYPNQGNLSFDSTIVPDAKLKSGQKRLLTVNNPLVVPVDTKIRILVTSTDVIHSWFVPAFGIQEYAVPGRINHAWFEVLRPAIYYGQCNQLCGVNHALMPIEIKALSKPAFARWLAGAKKKFAESATEATTINFASAGGRGGIAPR
jgi:cytochrome c oxidase subunit II